MKVNPIKTDKVTVGNTTLSKLLDHSISALSDYSVVVITSKIVSICEGRVVPIGSVEKKDLIRQESEYFIPSEKSKYNISLTITKNILIPTAGIDESNGNGNYILWPENPQKTASEIRAYLVKRFGLTHVGVLITDSKTTPMRLGTTGIALAYSGFSALNNYIGTPDLFGRHLEVTKANVADGLAASAVLVMGEGNEQTPVAVISDIPFIRFSDDAPDKSELKEMHIPRDQDIYGPLLENAGWVKGEGM